MVSPINPYDTNLRTYQGAEGPCRESTFDAIELVNEPLKQEERPPDYNHPILTTPTSLESIVPTRETILNLHFQKLRDFAEGHGHWAFRAVLYRKYVKFLYLKPVMDPDAFIFVTRCLLDLADVTTFLTLSFCNYMALGMKKMTKSNFTITHYLNSVRRQIARAVGFIERAAEELRAHNEEERQGETSGADERRDFPGQE
ncbi:hypothetical protein F5887DRAFT_1082651 [Amanita rubescens]|nr:hypothetical protein F5887DRAFT_1082651 [Amanita rubescens]